MQVEVQTIWSEIGKGFRMDTISGKGDGFRMGSVVDQGNFDSLYSAVKHYASLQNKDGWDAAADIYVGEKGVLALPLQPLSYIIEKDKIFDCYGNEKTVSDLSSAHFIVFSRKTGKSL